MDEWIRTLLGAAGGGLAATWGMLGWTNGRIRKLEFDRVKPEDCLARHAAIDRTQKAMWESINKTAENVAWIRGHLEKNER